jgi:hypothetical protein
MIILFVYVNLTEKLIVDGLELDVELKFIRNVNLMF